MLSGLSLKWGDLFFIVMFIALGLGGLVYNFYFYGGYEQKYVEVHVDNEMVKEISIDAHDEEKRIYQIPFEADEETHYAELEVKHGKVRMLPMGRELCPRGICSHTSWISREYETIVCVPNRIVISFAEAGNDSEEELDGITY